MFAIMWIAMFFDLLRGGGYFTYFRFPKFFKPPFKQFIENASQEDDSAQSVQADPNQDASQVRFVDGLTPHKMIKEVEDESSDNMNTEVKPNVTRRRGSNSFDGDHTIDRNHTHMGLMKNDIYDEVVQM